MADQIRPPLVNPLADEPAETDEARRDEARARGLPEHEIDEDISVGAGVMSQGGTAVDRGTGTTGGQAEGRPRRDQDPFSGPDDEPDRVVPPR